MVGCTKKMLFISVIVLMSCARGCIYLINELPHSIYTNDDLIADEIVQENFEIILAAINDKDAEAIKSRFSLNVIEEAEFLDAGIEYLFSVFPDGVDSYEIPFGAIRTDISDGRGIIKSINQLYWLYLDGIQYRFCIETCIRNDADHGEEGVTGILLISIVNEQDVHFDYRGIYIPESFLEENYPEKHKAYLEKLEQKENKEVEESEDNEEGETFTDI